jgi:ubiquinone/menaquinone biosynthesis C-methylase UbiE
LNHRRQFFDQAAADWDALEVEETHVRLREIVAGLDIAPGAAMLDVGCGTGILLPLLRENVNGDGHVVALDLSGEMLKRALGKGQPTIYVQGDAESLPLPEGVFDWVLCNAVFPHFPDQLRALAELRRVLRAGGRLVICHAFNREKINEFHCSVGGVVAHDAIPDEEKMLRLLWEAELVEAQVRDEPDRYLALACRNGRG